MLTKRSLATLASSLLAIMLLMPATGCILGTSPSTVNIGLRKEKQTMEAQIAALEQKVASDEKVIAGLRQARQTIPTLPSERLEKLFTTHGLELGRLTGGLNSDRDKPGDEGIKVHVAPIDEEGQAIKMVGQFTVEAFDLADKQDPLIGTWTFDIPTVRKAWRGSFLDYNYVLECFWKDRIPKHEEMTVKVTFLDELTQTVFTTQRVIRIKLPQTAATKPASQSSQD